MSNRFYFDASDSGSENGEAADFDPLSGLPFPKPLNRSAFLAEDFDPAAFLSTLSGRFQTLEDLQTELRELSQTLNKELVDLVNDNYQDFLSLGLTLSGGEEKVEEIRVGLLGFQRDISGVREKVEGRRREVESLVGEKRRIRQDVNVGRSLLEIAERLDVLESHLKLKLPPQSKNDIQQNGHSAQSQDDLGTWSDGWDEVNGSYESEEEDDDEGTDSKHLSGWLRSRVDDFLTLKFLTLRPAVSQHPFVLAEQTKLRRIKEKILTELDVAIKSEPDIKVKQKILQTRGSVEGDD